MWKNQESWHRDFSHLEEIKHWLRFHSGRQQNDAKRNRKWDRTNTSRPGHHRECEKAATCWIRRNSSPVEISNPWEQNFPTFAYLTDNLQCKHPHPMNKTVFRSGIHPLSYPLNSQYCCWGLTVTAPAHKEWRWDTINFKMYVFGLQVQKVHTEKPLVK